MTSPEKAAQLMKTKVNEFFEKAVFRGRFERIDPVFETAKDPRVSIIAVCAKKTARDLGYDFDFDIKNKLIFHINSKQDKISLSIGLINNGKNILTTESIACPNSSIKKANIMRKKYFKTLIENLLNTEKIKITQSKAFDTDLLSVMIS